MSSIGGIDHVVVRVSDVDRTARWFRDVLGFEIHPGIAFPRLRRAGVPFDLVLRPVESELAPSSDPGQRLDHLALHVPTSDELDRWQQRLSGAGIDAEVDHQPGNGSSISLFDPDGLEIELFTPDPDSAVVRQRASWRASLD